jgi:rod shape-determining protein MreC
MAEISLSRQRPVVLLAGALLFQIFLLAFQVKSTHDVRLIRYWTVEVVTPFERFGTWSVSKFGGIWGGYFGLRGARAENARLRSEVADLEMRNRTLESQAAEAQRLSVLLNFRETHPEAPMLAAQVIGASADPASHTIFVNRGEHDRVRRNMAVITPDGIVGKIVDVYPSTSQVLMISDRESGVGALLADTRTHGILKGNDDPAPRLEYVVNDEKVHSGEMVVTSGDDRIFPKGLLIGTIADAKEGNPFQVIRVQPAAHLDRLEEVMILLTQQELTPKKSEELANSGASSSGPSGIVQTGALSAPPSSQAPTPANTTSQASQTVPTSKPPAAPKPLQKAPQSQTPAPKSAPKVAPPDQSQPQPQASAPQEELPSPRQEEPGTPVPQN